MDHLFCYKKESLMITDSEPYKYIECPFCLGSLEAKTDKIKSPGCDAQFTVDNRFECVFADISDLRLPVRGTVCSTCGLVQAEWNDKCVYCGSWISGGVQ